VRESRKGCDESCVERMDGGSHARSLRRMDSSIVPQSAQLKAEASRIAMSDAVPKIAGLLNYLVGDADAAGAGGPILGRRLQQHVQYACMCAMEASMSSCGQCDAAVHCFTEDTPPWGSAHAHTRALTRRHERAHTHTHTHTHTRACTHAPACTHTHTHACAHACAHAPPRCPPTHATNHPAHASPPWPCSGWATTSTCTAASTARERTRSCSATRTCTWVPAVDTV
jgi:hypothetical protein